MQEIINDLKIAKKKKGITNKQIAAATGIPEGTVARVFANKEYNFKYDTIKPIVEYLITNDVYNDEIPDPLPEKDITELFKHINAEKNSEIAEMRNQYETLVYQHRNDIEAMRSHIKTLRICLSCLSAAILLLVLIDLSVTGIGWFNLG